MSKTHHIVFSEDLDGIVSAAIFLHNHVAGERYRLYPMQSLKRSDLDSVIENMNLNEEKDRLIILDFPNHPKSDLWIDRHFTSKIGSSPVRNSKMIYDPTANSTSEIVQSIKSEKNTVTYSDSFLEAVAVITKAEFKSSFQIFNDTHPLMILRAFLERVYPASMTFCRVVEMLRQTHMDFKKAIYQLGLGKSVISKIRNDAEKVSSHILVFGQCSLITQDRMLQYPKYAEFYVNPDIKYAIRVTPKFKDKLYVQIGYNKWGKEENEVNLGNFIARLPYVIKGGGHYSLAGGTIKNTDTERFMDDVSVHLNKEESMEEQEMEKNAVDVENDSVEVSAQEKVASGEAGDISEAREAAVSESEKPSVEEAGSEESSDQESVNEEKADSEASKVQ